MVIEMDRALALLKELNTDAGATKITGPGEAGLQLRPRRVRVQPASFVERRLDHVEPTHSGRSLEVQPCAPAGEKLGGFPAPVGQAPVDGAVLSGAVDGRAVVQQRLQQRDLHPGEQGMNTGRHQA